MVFVFLHVANSPQLFVDVKKVQAKRMHMVLFHLKGMHLLTHIHTCLYAQVQNWSRNIPMTACTYMHTHTKTHDNCAGLFSCYKYSSGRA